MTPVVYAVGRSFQAASVEVIVVEPSGKPSTWLLVTAHVESNSVVVFAPPAFSSISFAASKPPSRISCSHRRLSKTASFSSNVWK